MKIITLINGKEKVITDEFFETIEQKLKNTFIRLEDGSIINTRSIADIGEPSLAGSWRGETLDSSCSFYWWEGKKVYLTEAQKSEINFEVPYIYKIKEKELKKYALNSRTIKQLE